MTFELNAVCVPAREHGSFNNFIVGEIKIVFLSLFFSDLVPILEHKQQKAVSCLAWR